VFPADHVILKPQALFTALRFAEALATEHRVVDIGVPPSLPETGYGYIELGDELTSSGESTAYRVKRFVEKPNLEQAQGYLEAGTYIWNSGMFVWQTNKFLQALEEYLPDTYAKLTAAFESGEPAQLERAYGEIQDISVDYAIMEKVSDVVAIPVDFGWRDVGDWAALYDLMEKDADGNVPIGRHVLLDTEGCLLLSGNKPIATVGLRDLVVVETNDVLLIIPRNRTQEVKQLLDKVKDVGLETLL
jgi:mannose-1-phosphate guanylyltransferase